MKLKSIKSDLVNKPAGGLTPMSRSYIGGNIELQNKIYSTSFIVNDGHRDRKRNVEMEKT